MGESIIQLTAMAKGSTRVSRAGERVLAMANFLLQRCSSESAEIKQEIVSARDAETSTRDACATLLTRRSDSFHFSARRFQPENCFAFLHQIKPVPRDRFQIAHICLEQIDLARLPRQQSLLLVNQLLQIVDLRTALHQFFIRRHEQAYDDKPDGDDQKDQENPVQSLPDCGFATRAEISVTVLHFSGL